jgi:hypothetical protein
MSPEKKLGDKRPSPGISYLMPDGSWITALLNATGETVRSIQAIFWSAWSDHYRKMRATHISKPNPTRILK